MGIIGDLLKNIVTNGILPTISGGKQKKDGSHDHRTNRGDDRTPSQKSGDKKRRKD